MTSSSEKPRPRTKTYRCSCPLVLGKKIVNKDRQCVSEYVNFWRNENLATLTEGKVLSREYVWQKLLLTNRRLRANMGSHGVYVGVYRPQYGMKSRKQKSRQVSRRKTVLFGVWLLPEDKRKLENLAAQTGVDQSKLVRRALGLL